MATQSVYHGAVDRLQFTRVGTLLVSDFVAASFTVVVVVLLVLRLMPI